MSILKNDQLMVELSPNGAEIIKIIGQKDQINYMWRRDPILWSSSAPILFPIVGALQQNQYRIDGKTYEMLQHGFARRNTYQTIKENETTVIYQLRSNEEILKQYPYLFDLQVIYELHDNKLSCTMKVENIDDKEIAFQIGGHPAFACPLIEGESSNDYYLEFEKNETLVQKIIKPVLAGMSHETSLLLENERRFFVRQKLFDNDAIVVHDWKSKYIALKSLNHNKSIVFHMDHFNHLGIWASKHVGGLIAIEPWVGHADYVDFKGDFKEKEGIVLLQPKETFRCCFVIEINQ